ncbi:hypothetical protein BJ944DRAFT_259941 [Cunninghamella echinulata]|nr:hypothetical protein BJ944DRAFT_259941 [Cunninghamella echinulata]
MVALSQPSTDTTPLLGKNSQPKHITITRVPTFLQSSLPRRRSILKAFGNITIHLVLEIILPLILYYVLRVFLSPLLSLLLAGLPAAFIVIFKYLLEKKVDMAGLLTLVGFIISGILAMIQSDPKLYLLRESTMTLAMGCMLLITIVPLKYKHHCLRPFFFYVARQIALSSSLYTEDSEIRQNWAFFWEIYPAFRCYFKILTGVWAVALISEFIVRVALLQSLDDVDDVIYYSNLYMFIVIGVLGSMTIISCLLLRHIYNVQQKKAKDLSNKSEIDRIIAIAASEHQAGSST